MSMTKRYLESLPEAKQNAILGANDPEEARWNAAFDAYNAEHGRMTPRTSHAKP